MKSKWVHVIQAVCERCKDSKSHPQPLPNGIMTSTRRTAHKSFPLHFFILFPIPSLFHLPFHSTRFIFKRSPFFRQEGAAHLLGGGPLDGAAELLAPRTALPATRMQAVEPADGSVAAVFGDGEDECMSLHVDCQDAWMLRMTLQWM